MSDSFTYVASDGTNISAPATVTILVAPNDAPVAADDSYAATAGQTLSVSAPGVLANDTDPDTDVLSAELATGPTGGSLNLNTNGSFDYTPNEGTVSDSFTYSASDGTAVSAPATVTITVGAAENQSPVAVDDYANTDRNVPVFVNMTSNDSDPDGNLKDDFGDVAADQITIVTPPTRGGTVDVLTNGVNFTPKKNFFGTDVFTYTVTDLDGAVSNEATVRVNVIK
jgi:VCBS repeat-containing protein